MRLVLAEVDKLATCLWDGQVAGQGKSPLRLRTDLLELRDADSNRSDDLRGVRRVQPVRVHAGQRPELCIAVRRCSYIFEFNGGPALRSYRYKQVQRSYRESGSSDPYNSMLLCLVLAPPASVPCSVSNGTLELERFSSVGGGKLLPGFLFMQGESDLL